MHHVMIRYKLKPDQVEPSLRLLRDFYQELKSTQPEAVRRATFQLEDEVTFVDLVVTDSPTRFSGLTTFQRLHSTLDERCEEPPLITEFQKVGSYRFP